MSNKFSERMTRRDFIRALGILGATVVLEGCATPTPTPTVAPTVAPTTKPTAAPPPTSVPAPTTAPTAPSVPTATQVKPTVPPTVASRPDWVTAGKAYAGKSVAGLGPVADMTPYWPKRAEEFTKLTGIRASADLVASGDPYWAKLESELRARTGNVAYFAIDAANLSLYQQAGALEPLDGYLSNSKFPDWEVSDIPETVWDMMARRQGKIYGLPFSGECQAMHCRKDLLDAAGLKPPKTWQELYEAAKKLRKGDVWGAAWEMRGRYAALRFGNAIASGLNWLDKDLRLSALRDPRTIENMKIWRQMLVEGLIPPDTVNMDIRTVETLFSTGKVAMVPISWPTSVVIWADPDKSTIAGKTIAAPVPGGEANASGWSLAVSVDAKDKEAAYLYAAWLSCKEIAIKNALEYQDVGAFRSSVGTDKSISEMFLKRPHGQTVIDAFVVKAEAMKKARFAPSLAHWSGPCINAMSPIFQKIMAGEVPVEKGMNEAADAAEKILLVAM